MLVTELHPHLKAIFLPHSISCATDGKRMALRCVLAQASLGYCRYRATYLACLEINCSTLLFSEGILEEKNGMDFSWGVRRCTTQINGMVQTGHIYEKKRFFSSSYELDFHFGPYRQAIMELTQNCGLSFQDRLMPLETIRNNNSLTPYPPEQP